MKLTAYKAIQATVRARELHYDGDELNHAEYIAMSELGFEYGDCPLCIYFQQFTKSPKDYTCKYCPIHIITGVWCGEIDNRYHKNDSSAGLSLALYLQYEWERRYVHRRK